LKSEKKNQQGMQHINGLFTLYSMYSTYDHYPSKPSTNLQELCNHIDYLDVEFTLKTAKHIIEQYPEQSVDVKEAYLCLVALMEKFYSLKNSYQSMWVLANFRIGNLVCLSKDINLWHHKLITRLQLMQK
jgi:hypothetical protein